MFLCLYLTSTQLRKFNVSSSAALLLATVVVISVLLMLLSKLWRTVVIKVAAGMTACGDGIGKGGVVGLLICSERGVVQVRIMIMATE